MSDAPLLAGRRVAMAHEWLALRAGSEKTFEALAALVPHADLYALTDDLGSELHVGGRPVRTTFLDRHAALRRRRELTLPLMPLAWRTVTDEAYDVVVTSSHACAKGFRPGRTARHLCYCYTPARYLWDAHDRRSPLQAVASVGVRQALRRWDRRSAGWVDSFAAISTVVAERIAVTYERDARVVAPPVDTTYFQPGADDEEADPLPFAEPFVLAFSRLIPYKRLDLAIAAADRVGVPLVLAGAGPHEAALREAAGRASVPVHLAGRVSDARLRQLYRAASAFVFPALEDFGIVAVEAQACGTPVVALAAGGSLDTVEDGVTGALAPTQDAGAFADALEAVLRRGGHPEACVAHAARFSAEAFAARAGAWIRDEADG